MFKLVQMHQRRRSTDRDQPRSLSRPQMGALQNNTVRESYFVFCLWKALSLSVKNIQQLDERRSLMTFYNYKAQLLDEFSTSKMFLFEYDSLLH